MPKQRIYFDNAASTALIPEVIDAICDNIRNEYANPSSIHALGRKSRTIIEKARKTIAAHLSCSIGEVFFTSGATEANNTVIIGAVKDLKVDHIIYSPIEHPSVKKTIEELLLLPSISSDVLLVDQKANIDLVDFADKLNVALSKGKKILVSIMYVNNEIGTIQDIGRIAELCNVEHVYFHTDAVQALGKYNINLEETPISFLTASAHKFHGPKGIGFFYMNGNNIIKPMINGGAQERNMRSGTENTAYINGMSIAFDQAHKDMSERSMYIERLRQQLIDGLVDNIEGVEILGNEKGGLQQYAICNVSFPPHPRNEMMMMNLDVAGICASGGSACSSGIEYVSHVLEAIKVDKDRTCIRFSLSHMNTMEEVDIVIKELTRLLS